MKTPKPKTVKVECEVCGLDWKQHKPDAKGKVTLDECVRLLRAEIAKPKLPPIWSGTTTTWPTFPPSAAGPVTNARRRAA